MSGTMSTTFRRSLSVIATAGMTALAITTMAAQQKNEPRAPTFTVDPAWPSIPNNWVLGEVTSIAVDSRDHIWVLHVPRSIPESQRANAAPPVLEFDQAGKLLDELGRTDRRRAVARPRARHLRRRQRLRLDRRTRGLAAADHAGPERRHDPEVHDGRKARDADRPPRAESGQPRHRKRAPGHRRVRRHEGERGLRRRRLRQQARDRLRLRNRQVQAACGARSATRRLPTFAPNAAVPQPQTTPDGPPEFGLPHAIKVSRDGIVYVADRINNRIQMFTREGKFLKQVRVTNEGSAVVPVPAGFAFSPDKKQQFLYVVDSGPMRVVIFDRQTMTQIGVIGMKRRRARRVRHRPSHGGRLEGQSLHGRDRQQPTRAALRAAEVAQALQPLDGGLKPYRRVG